MKITSILGMVAILVGVAGFSFFQSFQANTMHDPTRINLSRVDQAEILGSTLQIEISIPAAARGLKLIKAEGLGSLVWDGERTLLVTHNHWGEILQEKAVVKFFDAHGQLVKTMSGSEFIGRMCYLDAGTLIFTSPVEWKGLTQFVEKSDPLQLKAGDIVTVAQHEGLERKEVTLVETEVESITTFRGVPVYRLKDLEGQPAQKGDSGGGVWHNGKLVGNLWYRMTAKPTLITLISSIGSDEAKLEATIESYAAGYPSDQLKPFQGSSGGVSRGESLADP